jgi:hypothetical protein
MEIVSLLLPFVVLFVSVFGWKYSISFTLLWERTSPSQEDTAAWSRGACFFSLLSCRIPVLFAKGFQMCEQHDFEVAKAPRSSMVVQCPLPAPRI